MGLSLRRTSQIKVMPRNYWPICVDASTVSLSSTTPCAICPYSLSLREVLDLTIDAIWGQEQLLFVIVLLGETELGPYIYQEMRGVTDPRRFLGKQCPLPLWGELARALVRRLDSTEPDYLIISDMAASGRPREEEFPWLERRGSLTDPAAAQREYSLRRHSPGTPGGSTGFASPDLRMHLVEIGASAAAALYHAQVRQDLQQQVDQMVGLQLVTRSLTHPASLASVLDTIVQGIAELLGRADVYLLINSDFVTDRKQVWTEDILGRSWGDFCVLTNRSTVDLESTLNTPAYRAVLWVIEADQSLFINHQDHMDSPEDLYYNDVGSAMLVPITSGDNPLGAVFTLAAPDMPNFDENDMVALRTMANTVALVLNLASGG